MEDRIRLNQHRIQSSIWIERSTPAKLSNRFKMGTQPMRDRFIRATLERS